MERGKYCYREWVPLTAMVTMECANVGLNTLFKGATLNGMSYHVFVVYSYAVAALLLLPSPFCSHRSLSLLCFFQTQFIPIKMACLIIFVS